MELSNRAAELFSVMNKDEKREMISLVLSNPRIEDSNIRYDYKKPFDMFVNVSDLKNWRDERQLPELFTPPVYLIDIINISTSKPPLDLISLRQKYQEKGLSLRQISAETFHSRQVVSDALKADGVSLRAPGQGYGNPSQLRFGYRKERGRVVPHLGEQQVIGAIKDLREEGMTFRQIAQRMTALKIPSKNGKFKWHPMMVKRALENRVQLGT